jgi:hypothetical protein
MNKIILLGHPSAGLAAVESLLQASGMQAALPSKRDGLLPQQITDTLCQAHGCAPLADAMAEDDLAPQQAGTVWHGLALDLLLGNLQQPLWGWADARSIYWLDYWAQLDPHITFVMVYDHPASALQASGAELLSGQHGTPPDMAVSRLLENWQAYNGAMLQFYSRQPGRCLLVNTQRARQQLADYLAQLGDKLHHRHHLTLEYTKAHTDGPAAVPQNQTLALAIEQGGGSERLLDQWFGAHSAVEHHLLNELLQEHPVALQIYEELEAAATVRANNASSQQAVHPGEAWIQLIEQRQAMASLTLSLYEQLLEQQQQYLGAQNQLALEARQAQSTQTQLDEARQHLKQAEEEGELLLAQLHQVQEELEKVFLNKQEQTQQIEALQAELKAAKAPVLAPPPDNTKVKDLEEENDLLLAQLHQVQEELERYYLENQDLKKKQTQPKAKPYGAAQRIQQQLSYRLGAAMIANSRSLGGWLRMPFALAGQVSAYRADQRAKAGQKLPPIHSYADAHEADRYRKHLSYQLGQTLLKHGKTPWGWLWMPFALAGTARAFKKSRAS